MLAKQWIGVFVSRMRQPVHDLRRWAHRHRAYRDGIDRWRLDLLIFLGSGSLQIAILLFLVGLVLYASLVDFVIFVIIGVPWVLALMFYWFLIFAPLLDGACPTTPWLLYGWWGTFWLLRRCSPRILSWLQSRFQQQPDDIHGPFAEDRVIPKDENVADIGVLAWVCNNLAGQNDTSVALDAVARLDPKLLPDLLSATRQAPVPLLLYDHIMRLVTVRRPVELERNAAELSRAWQLRLRLPDTDTGYNRPGTPSLGQAFQRRLTRGRSLDEAGSWNQSMGWKTSWDGFVATGICSALGGLVRRSDRPSSTSFSDHTRDTIYEILSDAAILTSNLLSVEHCAWLVILFCNDSTEAPRWIALVGNFLHHATNVDSYCDGWIQLPRDAHPIIRAVNGWAWVYKKLASSLSPDSTVFGHMQPEDAARCFQMSLEQLQTTTRGPAGRLSIFVPPSHTLQATASDRDHAAAAILAFLKATLLPRTEQTRQRHNESIRLCGTTSTVDEHSMLNILAALEPRGSSLMCTWRLAVATLSSSGHLEVLTGPCAMFCAQLSTLCALDSSLSVNDLYEQLVGNGIGARLILTANPSTTDAFDIARHLVTSARIQWPAVRTDLLAGEWRTTGHKWSMPAELVGAAEGADPCVDCARTVERLRDPAIPPNATPPVSQTKANLESGTRSPLT